MANPKIKILVDAHIFDHSYQGTATYIHGIYSELVKNDNVEIILCGQNTERLRNLFPDPRFGFIALKSASKFKRLAFEFPAIIKSGKFDYAHFQYIVPLVKNCRFINTIHDLLFLEYRSFFSIKYIISKYLLFFQSSLRSDLILTVSNYSKVAIARYFKIHPDKIYITPNAVTANTSFNPDVKRRHVLKKYILYVSRFEPRKNQIGLLKAYLDLNLSDRGYDLIFIGGKKEKIEIKAFNRLVASIPETKMSYIKFFENIPVEELNGFYREADCFVYPAFAEGFGIPPIEAAINNCKVLCSNQTAMSDFNFFKYSFDPNDQEDFSHQLDKILNDECYPFEKIKNAVYAKYNWNSISSNLFDAVEKDYQANRKRR